MKSKLNLKQLKVESFVTTLSATAPQTVQGGRPSSIVDVSRSDKVTDSDCWGSSQIGVTCDVTDPVSKH